MYVSEVCAEGIFVSFLWWLRNVKSRSKNSFFFQMSAILKFDFKKKKKNKIFYFEKTNNFFFKKLHRKDTILHMTITFSLKQGQTKMSSAPIWVPLKIYSLISYRRWSQKFQNLTCLFCFACLFVFASVCSSPLKHISPKTLAWNYFSVKWEHFSKKLSSTIIN